MNKTTLRELTPAEIEELIKDEDRAGVNTTLQGFSSKDNPKVIGEWINGKLGKVKVIEWK